MKKRILSTLLAVVMVLGIVTPALAYSTADFSDVPPNHWAYDSVMRMADAGVIKGTGNNLFSPELKVSAAQFLTLVGRVVFPDVKADGADWYGPYVSKAQEAGLLTGTQVDVNNVETEITRYDMAVILRAAAKKLGAAEKAAEQSQVTDYLDIPTRYADAVLAVYGMELIQGDQNGNFNGSDTMSRQEAATVMDRLISLKPNGVTDPTPDETEPPAKPEMATLDLRGEFKYGAEDEPLKLDANMDNIPFEVRYTEDNGKTYTVLFEGTTTDVDSWGEAHGHFEVFAPLEKTLWDECFAGGSVGTKGRIYISAETTINGRKYATQDRRTDGHATIVPLTTPRNTVELVPPNQGRTIEIEFHGDVYAKTLVENADGTKNIQMHYYEIPNSTAKIYYDRQQEGFPPVLIAETTAADGSINCVLSIDTAYYYPTGKCYTLDIEAVIDGQLCTEHRERRYFSMNELTSSTLCPQWTIESDAIYN